MSKEFPQKLKDFRKKRELTQVAAAEGFGVKVSVLRNWEQGRYKPHFLTQQALEDIMNKRSKKND